jgi:hypothetical protein
MHMHHTAVVLICALLCGCAANTRTATAVREAEPDCSFRSPTTCWTPSARFPASHRKSAAPEDADPRQAPVLFAIDADSAAAHDSAAAQE